MTCQVGRRWLASGQVGVAGHGGPGIHLLGGDVPARVPRDSKTGDGALGDGGVEGQAGPQTQRRRLGRRGDTVRIAETGLGAGHAADHGEPAVVVGVVEAKLGAAQQVGEEVLQRHAVLAVVIPVVARNTRHVLEVRIEESAQGSPVRAQVTPGAEAQHDEIAPLDREVVGGEHAAHRVGLGAVPLPLVEGLQRQVFGGRDAEVDLFLRQQAFLQLHGGTPELGDVEIVQRTEAAHVEGALAPVHHLLADTELGRHRADIEVGIGVDIEQLGMLLHLVLGVTGQVGALRIVGLGIDETGAAGEQPEVVVIQRHLGQELEQVLHLAGVVVQRAVVVVTAAGITAVAGTDDPVVGTLDPPGGSVGQGRVPGAVEARHRVAEIHGVTGNADAQADGGRDDRPEGSSNDCDGTRDRCSSHCAPHLQSS